MGFLLVVYFGTSKIPKDSYRYDDVFFVASKAHHLPLESEGLEGSRTKDAILVTGGSEVDPANLC